MDRLKAWVVRCLPRYRGSVTHFVVDMAEGSMRPFEALDSLIADRWWTWPLRYFLSICAGSLMVLFWGPVIVLFGPSMLYWDKARETQGIGFAICGTIGATVLYFAAMALLIVVLEYLHG